jgi:phenylalanine-4-hydroxylase
MKTTNNLASPLNDHEFSTRQSHIIAQATGATASPNVVNYLPHENKVWQIVSTTLRPIWDAKVADAVLEAREAIQLPLSAVPQLSEVSAKLRPLSGFTYHSVGGLVPVEDFFGALANKSFLSTQYLRHPKSPLYTPEPDIIHEVIGHGTCLADSQLATLHQLAGEALIRVTTKQARQFIADIWWFTGEFGVVRHSKGVKAYGAGILSSAGELAAFSKAKIRPLDIAEMATTPYRIDQLQPTLFAAESIGHLMAVAGNFFATVDDAMIKEMLRKQQPQRRKR